MSCQGWLSVPKDLEDERVRHSSPAFGGPDLYFRASDGDVAVDRRCGEGTKRKRLAHTDEKRTPLMGRLWRRHASTRTGVVPWEWSRAASGDRRRGRRQMVPGNQGFLVVLGKCEGCLCSQETLRERASSMVQTSGLFHGKVGRFISVGCERVAWGWRPGAFRQ